ncbi:MAG: hypothetical protein ACK5LK_05375, partial [Chthoniobacterales bacterium]
MLPENVIDFTRTRFPATGEDNFQVTPLEKGGSGRIFYRIRTGETSMIFAKYTHHREENIHFVDIANFLDKSKIQVPKIYHHDSGEGLIWMQDLGEEDLWSFRDGAWDLRRDLYCSALRQIALMHTSATRNYSHSGPTLQIDFNENLYLWEQEYFF